MKKQGAMDYRTYTLNAKENLLWVLSASAATGLVSWLFYQSLYAMAGQVPLLFLTRRFLCRYRLGKRRQEMLYQFGEMLQMMYASLKAGCSVENAFIQALKEYANLYGEKDIMALEFCNISHRMMLNEPLEQLMEDFAQRSGVEEIVSFSQVFAFAKRSGGDMREIFQGTVKKIRQKAEVEREIATVITAKKTEQRIMDLVPFGILFYVGMTSPEFLAPLYHNPLGVMAMTICLFVYAGAFFLAEKILDIQI